MPSTLHPVRVSRANNARHSPRPISTAALVAAALLWRGSPAGLPLAGLLLVMFTIETTSVPVDQIFGHLADPAAPLAAVPIMAALTLVGLWPLTVFLRGLRSPFPLRRTDPE